MGEVENKTSRDKHFFSECIDKSLPNAFDSVKVASGSELLQIL
jgi:hypothetical protein